MSEYRYILEKYKNLTSRHTCPKCGKKEFTLYIDTETNQPIHPTVGKCNRENNCNFHLKPKEYFIDNNIFETLPPLATKSIVMKPKPKPISYIDIDVFKATLKNYDNNNFIKFLISKFDEAITIDLIQKYFIGTSTHWNNSTVFYQRDLQGKIRAGKIILYNPETGKRVKFPFNHIHWLHSLLKLEDFNLNQCLFGLHLIKDTTKTIAIIESEKTAIIASVYLPQYIWLATGGKNNLRPELFTELKNRKVVFYPDLGCYDLWSEKAKTLGLSNYKISDLLETNATDEEKLQGLDLADYLLKYDYSKWRLKNLIVKQWKKFNPNFWDLSIPYDLQISCEYINANYKLNISEKEYFEIYQSIN